MHDDLLERRLGAALHSDADGLPFTITAAEIERRMALRRRSLAGRRLTMLFAAAVGISLVGIGGALSGLFNRSLPTPSETVAPTPAPRPTATAAVTVPPSLRPPLGPLEAPPGWTISGSVGPEFALETHVVSVTGAGVGEDHVLVVLSCTGTEPIEVTVEDGKPIGSHTQTFQAACKPDGNTTTETVKVTEQGVGVRYVAPKGAWTVLGILVPSS
jgi:hypothetical protein